MRSNKPKFTGIKVDDTYSINRRLENLERKERKKQNRSQSIAKWYDLHYDAIVRALRRSAKNLDKGVASVYEKVLNEMP